MYTLHKRNLKLGFQKPQTDRLFSEKKEYLKEELFLAKLAVARYEGHFATPLRKEFDVFEKINIKFWLVSVWRKVWLEVTVVTATN